MRVTIQDLYNHVVSEECEDTTVAREVRAKCELALKGDVSAELLMRAFIKGEVFYDGEVWKKATSE